MEDHENDDAHRGRPASRSHELAVRIMDGHAPFRYASARSRERTQKHLGRLIELGFIEVVGEGPTAS